MVLFCVLSNVELRHRVSILCLFFAFVIVIEAILSRICLFRRIFISFRETVDGLARIVLAHARFSHLFAGAATRQVARHIALTEQRLTAERQ